MACKLRIFLMGSPSPLILSPIPGRGRLLDNRRPGCWIERGEKNVIPKPEVEESCRGFVMWMMMLVKNIKH